MKTKIYIAGPITGHDLAERKREFTNVQAFLEDNQYKVVNPMELPHEHDKSWESYMKECIEALVKCNAIYLMPKWELSEGARLEFTIASKLKMKIINASK
jgi:nucleoside 2-deoxyribosyltransferase